jgi:hypothetical protein
MQKLGFINTFFLVSITECGFGLDFGVSREEEDGSFIP